MLEPLGEVGANFSLQLSSRTQFTKINNKKVIVENQCEKHKKSSLDFTMKMEKCYGVRIWRVKMIGSVAGLVVVWPEEIHKTLFSSDWPRLESLEEDELLNVSAMRNDVSELE